MHDDEQDTRAAGSVPNTFGNTLAWRWMRTMPASLKRSSVHTLLYALRAIANADGTLRRKDTKQPFRIRDIARAAGADEKDCRDRLEAARRAGVVRVLGERGKGRCPLYILMPTPSPDWAAAVAYLDGVKQAREEARQARAAKKGTDRKAAPWVGAEATENGGRSPELTGAENGGPPPELTGSSDLEERGTAPRSSSGDRPPFGSGDRPPYTPGTSHVSTHEMAGVGGQPQDARAPEEAAQGIGAAPAPALRPVPSPPGGRRPHTAEQASSSQRPLLLPVRSPQQVSMEELQALRAAATPEEIRHAIAELGATQATRVYGHRLVAPHLVDLSDHDTGT